MAERETGRGSRGGDRKGIKVGWVTGNMGEWERGACRDGGFRRPWRAWGDMCVLAGDCAGSRLLGVRWE